jgi:hypothetical protein
MHLIKLLCRARGMYGRQESYTQDFGGKTCEKETIWKTYV